MPKKLTQKEAEEKVKNYNNEYELISLYTKSTEPITVRHKCGKEYTISRYKSLFDGENKCPVCYPKSTTKNSTKPLTESDIINKINQQTNGEYTYIDGFKNTKTKFNIKHNTCGNIFSTTADMFLGKKQRRCPACANKKRGQYLVKENYLESLLKNTNDGNEYQWLEEYKNDNKKKLRILHKVCNREYEVRPNDFQQGYRCPHCSVERLESYAVSFIKKILNENNIVYKNEENIDGLKLKNKLKFDFVIGNLIIEYDGEQHFKPAYGDIEKHKKDKARDSIKNDWVQNQERYSLLRIHYKTNFNDLELIFQHIFNNSIQEIVNNYNLYYYDSNNDTLYNSKSYYTNINKDYFK